MKPELVAPPLRSPRGLGPILAGCVIGIVVALTVCRFIQADAERHFDDHMRQMEMGWHREHGRCWP